MSLWTPRIDVHRVQSPGGRGTPESPWIGWERAVESALRGGPGAFLFAPGTWVASRPLRLGSGVVIGPDASGRGHPCFVPGDEMESLFRIDGTHEVTVTGVRLEGRSGLARHGIVVRCGTHVDIRACRFDDFSDAAGAAVLLAGESEDRWVRGVAIEGCTFLNGSTGLRLRNHAAGILVANNRFEELSGPAIDTDPGGRVSDYDLLVVKNRIREVAPGRRAPLLRIGPGARSLRIAENTFEGCGGGDPAGEETPAALEIRGDDAPGLVRLEVLLNRLAAIAGPAIEVRDCGDGLVICGNRVGGAGTARRAAIDLASCRGVLLLDNDIREPLGAGVRICGGRGIRATGNDLRGTNGTVRPRSPGAGIVIEGQADRVRLGDNRVSGTRDAGIDVTGGTGLRLVGNEVRDCGEGIRVRTGRALVLVGNDCRENGGGGITVDDDVLHGRVALNRALRNGAADLTVRGREVRCRDNRVEGET